MPKGRPKGIIFSDEHKAKLSAAWTLERKQMLAERFTDKPISEETRRKLSLCKQRSRHTEEARQRISQALRMRVRKPVSEETKAKISVSLRGNSISDYCRQRLSEVHRGNQYAVGNKGHGSPSKETLAKMSAITKKWAAGLRDRGEPYPTSIVMRRLWANPDYATKKVQQMLLASKVKPNKAEQCLGLLLVPFGFDFVGDGKLVINGRSPDFYDGNRRFIELFGDYWHVGADPANRIAHFAKYGYDTLVIWEHELKAPDTVLERVAGWLS